MVPLPEGLPRRPARRDQGARRRADPRRGHHRLSLVARRRAGALRRHPGPVRAGQDRRRRAAGRRGRRAQPTSWTSSTRPPPRRAGREKIGHQGTFNSNPLCAAAPSPRSRSSSATTCAPQAEATAERHPLRHAARSWPRRTCRGASTATPRRSSSSRIRTASTSIRKTFDPLRHGFKELKARAQRQPQPSPAHRDAGERRRHHGRAGRAGLRGRTAPDEVARTLDAFRTSVRWMKAEGDIAP